MMPGGLDRPSCPEERERSRYSWGDSCLCVHARVSVCVWYTVMQAFRHQTGNLLVMDTQNERVAVYRQDMPGEMLVSAIQNSHRCLRVQGRCERRAVRRHCGLLGAFRVCRG